MTATRKRVCYEAMTPAVTRPSMHLRVQSLIAIAAGMGLKSCRIRDDACAIEFRWWFI